MLSPHGTRAGSHLALVIAPAGHKRDSATHTQKKQFQTFYNLSITLFFLLLRRYLRFAQRNLECSHVYFSTIDFYTERPFVKSSLVFFCFILFRFDRSQQVRVSFVATTRKNPACVKRAPRWPSDKVTDAGDSLIMYVKCCVCFSRIPPSISSSMIRQIG